MKATIYKTVEGFSAYTDEGKIGSGISKEEALMDLAYQYDANGEFSFEVEDTAPLFIAHLAGFASGVDYDELVIYVANEHNEGAVQSLFNEQQLEAGAHYAEAKQMLTENIASDLVAEYTAWKANK